MKFKSLEVINSSDRVSSVDIFRGVAIVTVVLFHFHFTLPYGYLGVDLFFVISGLLVGGMLTREFEQGKKVHFGRFFLQRGFKIWPSYYIFLILGNVLASGIYAHSHPEQIIPVWDIKRYLLFYQNYTGQPFHWSFDHIWSLCVEEHFYILLPLMFLILQRFVSVPQQRKMLFVFVVLTILAGIVFKYCSFFLTRSKDTYSATHNRIDALAWGVLLNLIISRYGERIRTVKVQLSAFLSGLCLFVLAISLHLCWSNEQYHHIYFHSIVPAAFFLMLLGAYYVDFSKLKALRFIAYYSYNWYLWHPVFVIFITETIGNTPTGLFIYLLVTFVMAILTTTFIEEPALKKRNAVLNRIFGKRS